MHSRADLPPAVEVPLETVSSIISVLFQVLLF